MKKYKVLITLFDNLDTRYEEEIKTEDPIGYVQTLKRSLENGFNPNGTRVSSYVVTLMPELRLVK